MEKMHWVPRAIIQASAVALLAVGLACGRKDPIPTTPPLAPTEPHQILQHLKYLAVRKDLKHIVVIAPTSPEIVFPSAWWFHKQATDLKIELTPEDLQALGIEKLKDRLPELPRSEMPDYGISDARLAFNAGMYRLVKAIPEQAWAEMAVMEIKPNPSDPRVKDVLLGLHGKPILKVSCVKKSETNYGVSLIQYQIRPSSLKVK